MIFVIPKKQLIQRKEHKKSIFWNTKSKFYLINKHYYTLSAQIKLQNFLIKKWDKTENNKHHCWTKYSRLNKTKEKSYNKCKNANEKLWRIFISFK